MTDELVAFATGYLIGVVSILGSVLVLWVGEWWWRIAMTPWLVKRQRIEYQKMYSRWLASHPRVPEVKYE